MHAQRYRNDEFHNKINMKGDIQTNKSVNIELEENEGFCARCRRKKPIEEFYIRKSNGKPFSYCIKCQGDVKTLKLKEKLERIVEERGGICYDCKLSYPIPIYEFYSENNIYQISKAKNMSLKRLKEELEGYMMLCRNCSALRQWEKN